MNDSRKYEYAVLAAVAEDVEQFNATLAVPAVSIVGATLQGEYPETVVRIEISSADLGGYYITQPVWRRDTSGDIQENEEIHFDLSLQLMEAR